MPRPNPQDYLPIGRVLSEPVRGEFLAMPLLGWAVHPKKMAQYETTPRVCVISLLMTRAFESRGTFLTEYPVYPETRDKVVAHLIELGWDGRVWPEEDGWPSGTDQELPFRSLLASLQMQGAMVFLPREDGAFAPVVSIERSTGSFLMPALPPPGEAPDLALVSRLQELCEDRRTFFGK